MAPMEQCIVCLESNADIFERITTESSEWKEYHIQQTIEKHLWWWYLKKSALQWICRQCWQEISSFHNFYSKVENAHKQFQQIVISATEDDDGKQALKLEIVDDKEESILTDEMGKQKEATKDKYFEILKIEESTIADVKWEGNYKMTDEQDSEVQKLDSLALDNTSYVNKTYNTDSDSEDILIASNGITPPSTKPKLITKPKRVVKKNAVNHGVVKEDTNTNKKYIQELFKDSQNNVDTLITSNGIKPNKLKRKTNPNKVLKKPKVSKKDVVKENSNTKKDIRPDEELFLEGQDKLECDICKAPLNNFAFLRQHFRNEHNTRGYAVCCGKKFRKRCLFIDHINVHKNPENFKCQHCSKTFNIRECFERHVKLHFMTRERNFSCEDCGKSFFEEKHVRLHMLQHVPESAKTFECNQCNKKFPSKDQLKHHERAHEKNYHKVCDICGKSYRNNFSFQQHMNEHAGIPASCETCNFCGLKLVNKFALNLHIKNRHTEKNLQEQICPYCSRISPNMNAHNRHIKYSHTMERKHSCNLCDKAFKRPLELKEHLSTHTGEALYTCPHCPRTFISNANMHKHRKIAHRVEWEEGRLKKFKEPRRKSVAKNTIIESLSNSTNIENFDQISQNSVNDVL